MRKVVIPIVVISMCVLVVHGCIKSTEDKPNQKIEQKKTSVGLPIGSDYLYRHGEHFVKITINSPDQWAIKTEEMNYPKKMTIKDLKKDKNGFKLIQFISKETIDAGYTFFVTDRPEGTNYYLVMDENDFYLITDSVDSSIDIGKNTKYSDTKFIKQ